VTTGTRNDLALAIDCGFVSNNRWHGEASFFVPVVTYPAVDNVPNWKDLSPRLGAVYDLFGNGKTAVKISAGRYVASQTVGIATANNPITRSVTSATRCPALSRASRCGSRLRVLCW